LDEISFFLAAPIAADGGDRGGKKKDWRKQTTLTRKTDPPASKLAGV